MGDEAEQNGKAVGFWGTNPDAKAPHPQRRWPRISSASALRSWPWFVNLHAVYRIPWLMMMTMGFLWVFSVFCLSGYNCTLENSVNGEKRHTSWLFHFN